MERRAGLDKAPDYRLTCFFVDRNYRRKGVAAVALRGALDLIAKAGGGVVEAYPQDTLDKRTSGSFLYNGTRSLFEKAGLSYERSKRKEPLRDAQHGFQLEHTVSVIGVHVKRAKWHKQTRTNIRSREKCYAAPVTHVGLKAWANHVAWLPGLSRSKVTPLRRPCPSNVPEYWPPLPLLFQSTVNTNAFPVSWPLALASLPPITCPEP